MCDLRNTKKTRLVSAITESRPFPTMLRATERRANVFAGFESLPKGHLCTCRDKGNECPYLVISGLRQQSNPLHMQDVATPRVNQVFGAFPLTLPDHSWTPRQKLCIGYLGIERICKMSHASLRNPYSPRRVWRQFVELDSTDTFPCFCRCRS